jgi:hypothetical protein
MKIRTAIKAGPNGHPWAIVSPRDPQSGLCP